MKKGVSPEEFFEFWAADCIRETPENDDEDAPKSNDGLESEVQMDSGVLEDSSIAKKKSTTDGSKISASQENEQSNECTSNLTKYIMPESNMVKPSLGRRIEYIDYGGESINGKVLNRGGKSTGIYRYCYNIEKAMEQSNVLIYFAM